MRGSQKFWGAGVLTRSLFGGGGTYPKIGPMSSSWSLTIIGLTMVPETIYPVVYLYRWWTIEGRKLRLKID